MAGKKEKKNSMLKSIISSMMLGKMMGKAASSAARGMKDMMSKKMSFKGGSVDGGIKKVKIPSAAHDDNFYGKNWTPMGLKSVKKSK